MHNNANKAKREATTNFVREQRGNRMFSIKYPHASMDKLLSAVTFENPKFRRKGLLRVVFSSQQRLNRPAVNAVQ